VAATIGAVPVAFALEMKLGVGKTLEHFFLVLVETVEFPYGADVARTGRTVAVLLITTTFPLVLTSTLALATAEETTTAAAEAAVVAAAVSV
jgi:hypothetical protein